MSKADPRQRSNRSCLIYSLVLFVILPIVLIGGVVLLLAGRDSAARRRLNERIEQLRSEDLPVDSQTLRIFHMDHTSTKLTQQWIEALNTLQSDEFRDTIEGVPIFDGKIESDFSRLGGDWPEEAATREFLSRWDSLVTQVHELATSGEKPVRFPIEWDSVDTLLPNTQQMRSAARLVQLKGLLAIHDRDSAATRDSIEALIGCSDAMSGEPVLVSQLVSVALDGMAISNLRRAIEQDVLDKEDLRGILTMLQSRFDIGPGWKRGLQGERAMMLEIFLNPSSTEQIQPNVGRLPFRSTDANHYLDIMENALSVPTQDLDEFVAGLEQQEDALQSTVGGNPLAMLDTVLTGLLTPALSAAGNAHLRTAVGHRLAAIAIAVRLYEKEHGQFPADLADVTEYGIDVAQLLPPGGQPFGYRVEDDAALLWGFDASIDSAVPAEPPSTAAGVANANRNREWQWHLEER